MRAKGLLDGIENRGTTTETICRRAIHRSDTGVWLTGNEEDARMVQQIINLIPGVLAATAGFFSLLFLSFLGLESNWLKFLVFIVIYIVVNVALDKAMTAYGKK